MHLCKFLLRTCLSCLASGPIISSDRLYRNNCDVLWGRAEPDMGPWVGSHPREGKQQILDERMINEVRLPRIWGAEYIALNGKDCTVWSKGCIGSSCWVLSVPSECIQKCKSNNVYISKTGKDISELLCLHFLPICEECIVGTNESKNVFFKYLGPCVSLLESLKKVRTFFLPETHIVVQFYNLTLYCLTLMLGSYRQKVLPLYWNSKI